VVNFYKWGEDSHEKNSMLQYCYQFHRKLSLPTSDPPDKEIWHIKL
jgi:hypothetical protein